MRTQMSGDRSLQLLIETSSPSSIYGPATFPDVLVQRPQLSEDSNPKFVPVVLFFFFFLNTSLIHKTGAKPAEADFYFAM